MVEMLGKTKGFRLVTAAIFVYDCSRLAFLISLLHSHLSTAPDSGSLTIPFMMYTAPNALFPLMSFFLFNSLDLYRSYIPLYITGKILALLCMLIWLLFTLQYLFDTYKILWAVFFCAADLGTIMGMAMQNIIMPNLQDQAKVKTIESTEGAE